MSTRLPIDGLLDELIARVRQGNVVLRAPTGAGKTTRVPPALLDAGLAPRGCIVVLEPRRLAARAAAARMAHERGGAVGGEIGYQVRFDRKWGPGTRIKVVTEGILLRMLQDDPFLEKVDLVILDEFHERSLDSDLALGMLRLLQQTVRPELPLVVMSATLAVEEVARYLGDCPILHSEGRLFPVEIAYQPRALSDPWPRATAAAVARLLDRTAGDILVFLPGLHEIRQTAHHLEDLARERDLAVMLLHGDLPLEQQDAALLPQGRRKVVLATNVAETSVTVAGITGVVDTGLARQQTFDARLGLDRLQITPISRASADQRAGRAGRTAPGICVRLWNEGAHRLKPEHTDPEIRRVDLAGALLQLLAMGEKDPAKFPWLEPPKPGSLDQARLLLDRLGAVVDGNLTPLGSILARLPVHPRLGRLLIEGHRLGHPDKAALAAALLGDRDPFRTGQESPAPARHQAPSVSDVLDRVEALEQFTRTHQVPLSLGTLHRGAAHFILRARDQLLRALRQEKVPVAAAVSAEDALLRGLLAAFPDRVVRRREPGSRQGVMVGGRGVRLAPSCRVLEPELFLAIDVDAGTKESLVRQASTVLRSWLPEAHLRATIEIDFDEGAGKVVARRRLRYFDLLLDESPAAITDENEAARVLVAAAAERLDRVVPDADSPAGSLRTRLNCLRSWRPELKLPAIDDKALLPWLCAGRRSLAEVKNADWTSAILAGLSHAQRQAVEREAPERLEVPSGSRITLHYEEGRPPVLAVRIQEVFGWRDTPRIAGGRVAVLLHLLAPNYRPQQVTDDLASFWNNTYPLIRKELRVRYPKHAWPEDPWSAPPQRGPRRR